MTTRMHIVRAVGVGGGGCSNNRVKTRAKKNIQTVTVDRTRSVWGEMRQEPFFLWLRNSAKSVGKALEIIHESFPELMLLLTTKNKQH